MLKRLPTRQSNDGSLVEKKKETEFDTIADSDWYCVNFLIKFLNGKMVQKIVHRLLPSHSELMRVVTSEMLASSCISNKQFEN